MIRRRDQIRLSLQKLGLRKKRALFSIISVALGIVVVVVINSLATSARTLAMSTSFIGEIDTNVILVYADESPFDHMALMEEPEEPAKTKRIQFMTETAFAEWRAWPGVEAAAQRVESGMVSMDALTNQPLAIKELTGVPVALLQQYAANPALLGGCSNAMPLVIGERYAKLQFNPAKNNFEPADAAYAATWLGREFVLRIGDPLAEARLFERADDGKTWKKVEDADLAYQRAAFLRARQMAADPTIFSKQLILRGRVIGFCPGNRILAPTETVALCSKWLTQKQELATLQPPDGTAKPDPEKFTQQGRRTSRPGEFTEGMVIVKPGADIEALAARLRKLGYGATTRGSAAESFIKEFDSGLKYVKRIAYAIAAAILAVAAALLWSTTSRIVSDSRADIGLFRALGATRSDVRRLFLSETVLLGWLGTLIGILCGWAIAWYISRWIMQKIALEMIDPENLLQIPDTLFSFDLTFAAILIVGSGVIAWLAGYWPARRAALIDPIKALRRE